MRILVTGATGYLGSHVVVALLEAGHDVVGLDDFSASSPSVLADLERLAGHSVDFVQADVGDEGRLGRLLAGLTIDAAIHLAGRRSVAESVADPVGYYERNVGATARLLGFLQGRGVRTVVYSSSCAVYGDGAGSTDTTGDRPSAPTTPYGHTKATVEDLLRQLCSVTPATAISLRIANPIGAHHSGALGDAPLRASPGLVPVVLQVAAGVRARVPVFGDDHPTPDGTTQRDYVHVSEVAAAHVLALELAQRRNGFTAIDIGRGRPVSVLEVVEACRRVTGQPIPLEIVPEHRPGDAAVVVADPTPAADLLGWRATADLDQMCLDQWEFVTRALHDAA